MQDIEDLATLCKELVATSQLMFATDHPEVAYHLLEAAVHCAMDLSDASTLRQIEALATEQHRRVSQRISPALAWDTSQVVDTRRWVSFERIYAAAVRQASTKAATLEMRNNSRSGRARGG